MYTACTSGSTGGTNGASLAEATVAKGAKAAVGFNTTVEISEAQSFEFAFLSMMRSDEAYKWNANMLEPADCNQTVHDAAQEAASWAGLGTGQLAIIGQSTSSGKNTKNMTLAEMEAEFS